MLGSLVRVCYGFVARKWFLRNFSLVLNMLILILLTYTDLAAHSIYFFDSNYLLQVVFGRNGLKLGYPDIEGRYQIGPVVDSSRRDSMRLVCFKQRQRIFKGNSG